MNDDQVRYLREILDQLVSEGDCTSEDLLMAVKSWAGEGKEQEKAARAAARLKRKEMRKAVRGS